MAVRLSAICAGRALLPRNFFSVPDTHFCQRLSKPQGLMRLEGLVKLKKFNSLLGTRTRDLPTCSLVPQQITLPLAPSKYWVWYIYVSLSGSIISVRKTSSWQVKGEPLPLCTYGRRRVHLESPCTLIQIQSRAYLIYDKCWKWSAHACTRRILLA
jgi:hypothetical protein